MWRRGGGGALPADLFTVAGDGFHKPNGTDTPADGLRMCQSHLPQGADAALPHQASSDTSHTTPGSPLRLELRLYSLCSQSWFTGAVLCEDLGGLGVRSLAFARLPFVAKLKGHGTCNVIRATREGEQSPAHPLRVTVWTSRATMVQG